MHTVISVVSEKGSGRQSRGIAECSLFAAQTSCSTPQTTARWAEPSWALTIYTPTRKLKQFSVVYLSFGIWILSDWPDWVVVVHPTLSYHSAVGQHPVCDHCLLLLVCTLFWWWLLCHVLVTSFWFLNVCVCVCVCVCVWERERERESFEVYSWYETNSCVLLLLKTVTAVTVGSCVVKTCKLQHQEIFMLAKQRVESRLNKGLRAELNNYLAH